MKRSLARFTLPCLALSYTNLSFANNWEEWEVAYHQLLQNDERRSLSLLQERYHATPYGYDKLYVSSRLFEFHALRGQPYYGIRSNNQSYSDQEEKFIAALNSEKSLLASEAIESYQELLKAANLENNIDGKILFEYHLCRVLNQQGQFYQASPFCSSLNTHINDSVNGPIPDYKAYRVIANNHEFLGDYQAALNTYQLYLSNIPRYVDPSGVYNDAGLLLKQLGNTELAKEYLSISIDLRESMNSPLMLAQSFHSMGDILLANNQFEDALGYFNKSEAILTRLNHQYGLTYVTLGLGKTHIALGEFELGTQLLLSALETATSTNNEQLEGEIYLTLANANTNNDKHDVAQSFAHNALTLAERIESDRLKVNALKTLAEIAKDQGKFELALDFYQQYTSSELNKLSLQNRTAFLALDSARHEFSQDKKVDKLEQTNKSLNSQLERASSLSHLYQLAILILIAALVFFFRQKKQQMKLAEIDLLTGALNRAASIREIKQQPKLSDDGHMYLIILLDLDDFKTINDNYGHPTGDTALTSIAQTIVNYIQPTDIFGRLGGEEFVIVMKNVDELDINDTVNELHAAIAATQFSAENNELLNVTASVSYLATSKPLNDFDELYSILDQALYQAKQNGKNRVIDAFNEPIHLPISNNSRPVC